MVLFRRKPVQYKPRPALFEDQEIWVIEETEEVFTNYDEFLDRMDFYKKKRFIDEITGHSGLDFFSALRTELEASNQVDDSFPDNLREPILRKVQHSTISRIDSLVDHVFDEFKHDFYPGETVNVIIDNPDSPIGDRVTGIVREKTRFPEMLAADGTVERKPFARYFISILTKGHADEEAVVDHEHVFRDRKSFTKQMLRSYLKNSLHRESWSGAPWQVKERIAQEYRINTEIPPRLRQEFQMAQRKANSSTKKGGEHDGTLLNFFGPNRLPELKPRLHKGKVSAQDAARQRHEQYIEYQRALARNPGFSALERAHIPGPNDPQFIQFINENPDFPANGVKASPKPQKYPVEDLELPPQGNVRPPMKFLTRTHDGNPSSNDAGTGLLTESVGPLLETWDTLNVYCEVFLLDSFTFDDYLEALQFTSEGVQCELLVELHCAILKKLVNGEQEKNGQVQITLPKEAGESESGSDQSSPVNSPEPEAKPRATRSSLARSEAAELKAQAAVDAKLHNAAETDQCVRGYGWKTRLRKRDFSNGRWIVIVVGLLNLFSSKPRLKKSCEDILIHLAPKDMDATEETAISQYAKLDANVRVRILQFLCMLSVDTAAIRGYMEDCTASMTQFRKDKIEWQRKKKAYIEQLKALAGERRELQPDEASPVPELKELVETEDEEMKDADENESEDTATDSDDGEPIVQRSLRRANDRTAGRRKRAEEERKRQAKAATDRAKKPTKEARRLERVMKEIDELKERIKECEAEIAICDDDLRENDCPRTRMLGRDRFHNRYYWFERNAMPYAGLPDSSTADAGYANGRVWVQGPDDSEREGFINLPDYEQTEYENHFGVTVPERKALEEGETQLQGAVEWGYYDDPESLDGLIGWLDKLGKREVKLRKELLAQREMIVEHMGKRREYLSRPETDLPASAEPVARISTRTKTYVDPGGFRFMAWKNTTALREQGHIHSEPAKGPKKGVARAISRTKPSPAAEDEGRQTRASSRQAKPIEARHGRQAGRQGTRYSY